MSKEIKREKMPVSERAKQFCSFAALRGFEEMIKEAESKSCKKEKLSEEYDKALSDAAYGEKNGDSE